MGHRTGPIPDFSVFWRRSCSKQTICASLFPLQVDGIYTLPPCWPRYLGQTLALVLQDTAFTKLRTFSSLLQCLLQPSSLLNYFSTSRLDFLTLFLSTGLLPLQSCSSFTPQPPFHNERLSMPISWYIIWETFEDSQVRSEPLTGWVSVCMWGCLLIIPLCPPALSPTCRTTVSSWSS